MNGEDGGEWGWSGVEGDSELKVRACIAMFWLGWATVVLTDALS